MKAGIAAALGTAGLGVLLAWTATEAPTTRGASVVGMTAKKILDRMA